MYAVSALEKEIGKPYIMKSILKNIFYKVFKNFDVRIANNKRDIDALYKLLYDQVHNLDRTLPIVSSQTEGAFGYQWDKLQEGEAMLSDKWFKDNVTEIITERETLIRKEWFKGKDIIDCGCGGGRWSYGLAKLGANITAVDINESAIEATRNAIKEFDVKKEFVLTPLEQLSEKLPADKKYDMVWSWGVLHHCNSFNDSFRQVMARVKEGGFIYLYLYGRESVSYEEDVSLFKNRVRYNTLQTWKEKEDFLVEKSHGDRTKLHQNHDMYAPLLNRRLEFDYVKKMLEEHGFTDIVRTVKNTELHIRAVKTKMKPEDRDMIIHNDNNPFWFKKYNP